MHVLLSVEELRDFANSLQPESERNVRFRFEAVEINMNVHKSMQGRIIFSLLNSDGEKCIKIEIDEDEVYLADYYFITKLSECPKIRHETFFHFLKQLGNLYGKPVTLYDLSTKSFEFTKCRINSTIFALAGRPTFYERFGFQNADFRERIQFLGQRTLDDVIDRRLTRSDAPFLANLKSTGMTLQSTVSELANFLVSNCKRTHIHNKEFSRRSRMSVSRTRRYHDFVSSDTFSFLLAWLQSTIKKLKLYIPTRFEIPLQ